jgi:voltage-dependent anion channel protein 2
LNVFSAAFFHRVAPDIEAGARAVWDKKSEGPVAIEVGTRYVLDRDTAVRAKINNAGILGLSYSQVLRPGVKATMAGSFDTTRLQENGSCLWRWVCNDV